MFDKVVVSDAHIGGPYKGTYETFIKFLQEVKTKELILLGDIVDLWGTGLTKEAEELMIVLDSVAKRIKVTYVTGNHDDSLVHELSKHNLYPSFDIVESYSFGYGGEKYLLLHGDQFDYLYSKFSLVYWIMSIIGKFFGMVGVNINKMVEFSLSKKKGNSWYRSLTTMISYVAVDFARRGAYDVIIMGHTHVPIDHRFVNGVRYINSGDRIDSQSSVVFESGKCTLVC